MAVAQQKGIELLACLALLGLHVVTGTAEVAHPLLLPIGHPHRREVRQAQRPR